MSDVFGLGFDLVRLADSVIVDSSRSRSDLEARLSMLSFQEDFAWEDRYEHYAVVDSALVEARPNVLQSVEWLRRHGVKRGGGTPAEFAASVAADHEAAIATVKSTEA